MTQNLDPKKFDKFKLIPNWSLGNKLEILIIPYILTPIILSFLSKDNMFMGWKYGVWVKFTIIISIPYILIPLIGLIIGNRGYRFKIFMHFYIISTLIAFHIFGAVGFNTFDPDANLFQGLLKYGILIVIASPIAIGVFYSVYREVEIYIFRYILIQNELDRSRNDIETLKDRITEQSKIIDYLKDAKTVVTDYDHDSLPSA